MDHQNYLSLLETLHEAPKEYEGHTLHCRPSFPDVRDIKYNLLCGGIEGVQPVTIDYREQLPAVFDQGQRGTCVACAADWGIKAYQEMKQGDFPEEGLSAAFIYSMAKRIDGVPTAEGTTPKAVMQVLHDTGICPESDLPYSSISVLPEGQVPDVPEKAIADAANFKIKTYAQLCTANDASRDTTVDIMRQALQSEGPFLAALLVCTNFVPDANGFLPLPEGQIRGGHAISIAGDLPDKNAFLLRNSWGPGWGMNGYAYLPYDWITAKNIDIGYYLFEAWTATDIVPEQVRAKKIVITVGADTMMADGKAVVLDQPAVISRKTNRALGPIRTMADNMGYPDVVWDGNKRTITLNSAI